MLQNLRVQAFFGQLHRHGINRVYILHGNHAGFGHVAEQRDFLLQVFGNVPVAAAQQNIRLNSDPQHLFDTVLRRLGFQFAGRRDKRHQRYVHKQRVVKSQLQPHLPNRFQKGQRLNVADRPADFDDHHVHAFGNFPDGVL